MTEPIDRLAPFKAKGLIGWNDYQALYNLAEDLQSDLNSANAELDELNAWKSGKRGIEDFYIIREELHKTQSQLAAHKTALGKCEKALTATWTDLDHLNHWMPTPCRELYMEAKLEIARLKGNQ